MILKNLTMYIPYEILHRLLWMFILFFSHCLGYDGTGTCTDMMALGKSTSLKYRQVKTPFGNEIGMVARETLLASDNNVYLFYVSERCKFGKIKYNCIFLKTFSSYQQLQKRNTEACWGSEIHIAAQCRLPTIRIVKGVIYCELEPPNGRGKPIIASINLKTGQLLRSRIIHQAKIINNCLKPKTLSGNRDCSGKMHEFFIHTLVDDNGFSILYQTPTNRYVFEEINLNNLSTRTKMTIENLGPSIRALLICNKLYVIPVAPNQNGLKITKAIDLNNLKNKQNYVIEMAVNFKDGYHKWLHYNPRHEEIFVGHANKNSNIIKVLKCESPFPDSKRLDLSRIVSTFLWSLVPTDYNHKLYMLQKLESFFRLTDPKSLDYISSMLLKCPSKTCHDSHNTNKLYCRMKSLTVTLKIYSNYRQTKKSINKSRKNIQVFLKLDKLLEQQTFKSMSSKIYQLKSFINKNFLELKKQMNSFRDSMGTYFHSLAEYDQSTSNSDMNLIYDLIGDFQKKSETLGKTVQKNLIVILGVAFGSKLANIAQLTARVLVAASAFLNPFDMIADAAGNILQLAGAIDDLTKELVNLTRLFKLIGHIKKLGSLMATLGNQIKVNAGKYTAIRAMVAAGKKHAITDKAINSLKDKFLIEYDNYQPFYSKSLITKFGALLESITDALCEILFSGATSASNLIQLGFVIKGDCFKTKLDVQYLIALYEDMYDHQESLIDAFASVVRATVAKHNAQKIMTITNEVKESEINNNHFTLKLYALEVFVNSEIHRMILVQDVCYFLEYKNGAKMPHFCKRAIENPQGPMFDQLTAIRFDRDMCADDEISLHVQIPAMENSFNKNLPPGVIDLNALYSEKISYFQVPSYTWLIKNRWIQRNANQKLVLKKIQLYLPFLQKGKKSSSIPVDVHVSFKLAGDNRMTPKGSIYEFNVPMEYNFRYKQNNHFCAHPLKQYTPYVVQDCQNHYKTPPICVISAGTKGQSPVYPSVFAKWEVQAFISGKLQRPRPKNIFYLRADVTLCVVKQGAIGAKRKKRNEKRNISVVRNSTNEPFDNTAIIGRSVNDFDNSTNDRDFRNAAIEGSAMSLRKLRASGSNCCFDSKKFYDFDSGSCRSCSKGFKPNLYGYYCEKTD